MDRHYYLTEPREPVALIHKVDWQAEIADIFETSFFECRCIGTAASNSTQTAAVAYVFG